MKKLSVKLSQDYKSFKSGFEYFFEGQLTLLSGVNGGGKSQLIDIIHNQAGVDSNRPIAAETKIDELIYNRKDVIYRSFKESISIPEINNASTLVSVNSKNQVWDYYNRYLLDANNQNCINFSRSCDEAKQILLENFTQQEFTGKQITQEELKKTIPSYFIWKPDDLFTNIVGELFFNYASRVYQAEAEAGRKGIQFDKNILGSAPWSDLNDLFKELGLEYRFKEDYRLNEWEINEQPKLYAIKEDGSVDEDNPRLLTELSDGEKAIISLSFASLSGVKVEEKKILLLDEFDATFNPSLTEIFFKILDKYFISKGILVILATHAPTTISLAPENTRFYEVYKKKGSRQRILEINKDSYAELALVNKRFYDKIADQEARIEEILNGSLGKNLENNNYPLIITEGKTDWKYFVKALDYYHERGEFNGIKKDYFMRFGSSDDVSHKNCGTNIEQEMGDTALQNYLVNLKNVRRIDDSLSKVLRIGIYDSDNKGIKIIEEKELGVISFKISPDNVSTEFLFDCDEIKQEVDGKRLYTGVEFNSKTKKLISDPAINIGGDSNNLCKAGKNVIIDTDVFSKGDETSITLSKELFAEAVFNGKIEISSKSWENFRPIFDKIKNVLPPVTT